MSQYEPRAMKFVDIVKFDLLPSSEQKRITDLFGVQAEWLEESKENPNLTEGECLDLAISCFHSSKELAVGIAREISKR